MKPQEVAVVLAGCVLVLVAVVGGDGQSSQQPTSPATTPNPLSTSMEDVCRGYNENCETCVKHASCLWCKSEEPDDRCKPYPTGRLIPHKDDCPLDQARWGVCWMNYQALLISMGIIAVIIIIASCVCCYCCCCKTNKRKQQKKFQREDAAYEREREERRTRSDERRSERKSKYDEIRRKYGLIKEDTPYQKFDNELETA